MKAASSSPLLRRPPGESPPGDSSPLPQKPPQLPPQVLLRGLSGLGDNQPQQPQHRDEEEERTSAPQHRGGAAIAERTLGSKGSEPQDVDSTASDASPGGATAGVSTDESQQQDWGQFFTVVRRKPGQSLGMGIGLAGPFVVVTAVDPGSPADLARLAEFDVLASANDELITPENVTTLLRPDVLEIELGVNRDDLPDEPPPEGEGATAHDSEVLYATVSRRPGEGLGLGIGFQDGVIVVTSVDAGSPAQRAGLLDGDVLVSANGVEIAPDNVWRWSSILHPDVLEIELGVRRTEAADRG